MVVVCRGEEIVEMRVRTERQSWNPRRALQIRELQGPGILLHYDGSGQQRRLNDVNTGENREYSRRVRILMAVRRGKTGRESDRSSIRGPRIIPTQHSKHIPTMSQPTVTGHGITVSINEMRDRKNSSALLPADAHIGHALWYFYFLTTPFRTTRGLYAHVIKKVTSFTFLRLLSFFFSSLLSLFIISCTLSLYITTIYKTNH